jgi:hypothetical protein
LSRCLIIATTDAQFSIDLIPPCLYWLSASVSYEVVRNQSIVKNDIIPEPTHAKSNVWRRNEEVNGNWSGGPRWKAFY